MTVTIDKTDIPANRLLQKSTTGLYFCCISSVCHTRKKAATLQPILTLSLLMCQQRRY